MRTAVVAELEAVVPAAGAPTDRLVECARGGDRDAFTQLIAPRAGRLLKTARAILGNEADAYEATQEALIAAWIRLPSLRDPGRFDAWLDRTLVNKCRDAVRGRRRIREIDIADVDVTVADDAEDQATRASVLAAFDRLSIDDRHILVMHHLHGLSVAQIAGHLDVPIGTAKSRLWSSRRALERALQAEA